MLRNRIFWIQKPNPAVSRRSLTGIGEMEDQTASAGRTRFHRDAHYVLRSSAYTKARRWCPIGMVRTFFNSKCFSLVQISFESLTKPAETPPKVSDKNQQTFHKPVKNRVAWDFLK